MENFEQLTIFDFIEPTEPDRPKPIQVVERFKIGEKVRIKRPDEVESSSPEDLYMLKTHGGRKGIIADIYLGSVPSYYVQLATGECHYYYARELILLG